MNPLAVLLTLEFQRYRAAGPDKYAANGWQKVVANTGGARKRGGGGGNYRPPAKATAAHHEDDDFNFGANDSDSFAKRFEEAFEAYRREHE